MELLILIYFVIFGEKIETEKKKNCVSSRTNGILKLISGAKTQIFARKTIHFKFRAKNKHYIKIGSLIYNSFIWKSKLRAMMTSKSKHNQIVVWCIKEFIDVNDQKSDHDPFRK